MNEKELLELAKHLKVISTAINNFQIAHWHQLSDQDFILLNRVERRILVKIHQLTARSISVMVANSADFLATIDQSTVQLEKTLKTVKNVHRGMQVIQATLTLVNAVGQTSPAKLLKALENFSKIGG